MIDPLESWCLEATLFFLFICFAKLKPILYGQFYHVGPCLKYNIRCERGLRLRYFPYIEQNHAWSADYQAAGRNSCSLNYTFTHIVVFRSTIQVCSPNTVLRRNINVGKSRPVFPISIQRNSGIHFRDMMPVVTSLHGKSAPSGYKLE